ncbi:hypothetical protein TRIUR3_28339 [Triticum urartu]|uniref:Uncharacterized protein n=1 Tax=Triticum urartu TaxID=4572 RepID=M7YK01_TRIUA|nr:hypothetical protein TRIUR3_28339 [Triticum urartu]
MPPARPSPEHADPCGPWKQESGSGENAPQEKPKAAPMAGEEKEAGPTQGRGGKATTEDKGGVRAAHSRTASAAAATLDEPRSTDDGALEEGVGKAGEPHEPGKHTPTTTTLTMASAAPRILEAADGKENLPDFRRRRETRSQPAPPSGDATGRPCPPVANLQGRGVPLDASADSGGTSEGAASPSEESSPSSPRAHKRDPKGDAEATDARDDDEEGEGKELGAEDGTGRGGRCRRSKRDKSEAMMEARQFRRFAEERFAHDASEVAALHDAIARRDASIQSLSEQLRVCRSRLIQLGFLSPSFLPSSPTAAAGDNLFADDYPSIQCLDYPAPSDVGTPRTHHMLYTMPGRDAHKGVICASPRRQRHGRALSNDSLYDGGIAAADEFTYVVEQDVSDLDDDCDRVYTVDAVHRVPVAAPEDCCYFQTPMGNDVGFVDGVGAWAEEQQIQKLSARLQALEADRESMRHAIMSMGAEKAQVVMLKDIAHQLCEEAAPLPAVSLKLHPVPQAVVAPKRKLVKRQPFCVKFFIVTAIKVNSAGLVLL